MKIIAVADSFAHFEAPIVEFIKRLKGEVILELVSPTKHADSAFVIRTETERIRVLLERSKQSVVYLDIIAAPISTEDLVFLVKQLKNTATPIIFLIGWAFGIDKKTLSPYIRQTLSLSPMTLPHSLALLVILEQLYRVISIEKGSKYHHG
jgi:23S rRNA (pseudouridine1915-N3)-methyltransferase